MDKDRLSVLAISESGFIFRPDHGPLIYGQCNRAENTRTS
jgi:hypothetical protein